MSAAFGSGHTYALECLVMGLHFMLYGKRAIRMACPSKAQCQRRATVRKREHIYHGSSRRTDRPWPVGRV